jgi:hypothetical protein
MTPEPYADYQFRLNVLAPVAADSPFDSDTLWGRLVCALMGDPGEGRQLGEWWLDELQKVRAQPSNGWQPPILVSEGFLCDGSGTPWLPLPFASRLKLERDAPAELRKHAKKIECVPLDVFARACEGEVPPLDELFPTQTQRPRLVPALHPHLAMNRASGTGIDGMLFMSETRIYSSSRNEVQFSASGSTVQKLAPAEIVFLLRLRGNQGINLIELALRRICNEGWGNAKSRGLGRLHFKSLESWQPPGFAGQPDGFVSVSSFCPAADDPTEGYWKLDVKSPVPAQFVDGRRVTPSSEDGRWRPRSFLRLRAGSCFRLPAGEVRTRYGRMLTDLLEPAEDADGQLLPRMFHYALACAWPMRWPKEV